MSLAENLRKLRETKNLTQNELSKLLNINRATYAHYETGRREPDYNTLKLIADFYGISVSRLLGEIDEADIFLGELKKEMKKQGLKFDEADPKELIEVYKILKQFKENKSN